MACALGGAVGVAARLVQADDGVAHDLEVIAREHEERLEPGFRARQVVQELQTAQQRAQRSTAHVVHGLGQFLAGSLRMGSQPDLAHPVDQCVEIMTLLPEADGLPFLRVVRRGVRNGEEQLREDLVEIAQQHLILVR